MSSMQRLLHGCLILTLLLALAACSAEPTVVIPTLGPTATRTPRPTRTPTPTLPPTGTPEPTATPTQTGTPTPALFAQSGTPVPYGLQPIAFENAGQVSALAEWYEATVSDMAWAPDGRLLAVADQRVIHFYDLSERQVLRALYPNQDGVVDIAFSPRGDWLVVGSRRGSEEEGFVSSLELWRGPDWKPLGTLYGTERPLIGIDFSPEGNYFAAAYTSPANRADGVDLWNSYYWTISRTLDTQASLNVAFSVATNLLAVSPDRYALKLYDLVERTWLFRFPTSFTGAITTFVFSPDGFTLATGHYDGYVRLWDIRNGKLLVEFKTEEVIQSLAFSPDGRLVATGGSYQNDFVRLWSAGSGELLRTLEGHTSGVTRLLFSPDSQYLVSASYDGTLRLWGIRP
jgi:WD40 repeat protein